jgi:hypothetical protein
MPTITVLSARVVNSRFAPHLGANSLRIDESPALRGFFGKFTLFARNSNQYFFHHAAVGSSKHALARRPNR